MREELHRFFRAARGAGVRVSPAESIDAMKAVADVGFADRGILRDTLLLTLAKSEDEKQALGDCFDLFFSQPEVKDENRAGGCRRKRAGGFAGAATGRAGDAGAPSPELGELAQMLMSRDRNAIAAAMANCGECRLAFRHPLFYPAWHLLDADSRPARHRAPARRSGRADSDQSGGCRTARGGIGGVARKCAATSSIRRWCSTGARKAKTCATKSCATRRSPGSNAGRSSR